VIVQKKVSLDSEDPISRVPVSVNTRIFMGEPTLDNLSVVFNSGNELVCRETPVILPE